MGRWVPAAIGERFLPPELREEAKNNKVENKFPKYKTENNEIDNAESAIARTVEECYKEWDWYLVDEHRVCAQLEQPFGKSVNIRLDEWGNCYIWYEFAADTIARTKVDVRVYEEVREKLLGEIVEVMRS